MGPVRSRRRVLPHADRTAIVTDTVARRFRVAAEASPGLLPRLLEAFAKRDLTADAVEAKRQGEVLEASISLHAMPAGMVHLIAGNLGQVVGVTRVEVMPLPGLSAAA